MTLAYSMALTLGSKKWQVCSHSIMPYSQHMVEEVGSPSNVVAPNAAILLAVTCLCNVASVKSRLINSVRKPQN